jgi:sugar-specific transcriptional regulator TrmB
MNTYIDKTLLKKIGLGENEIEIYLALIKTGAQTVKQISEAARINRTTTYRYLESLAEKELIEWIIGKRGQMARATSPDNLNLFLKSRLNGLSDTKNALPSLVSELKKIQPVQKFATQIRYFEGEEGLKQMIWNTLKTKEVLRSYSILGRREVINAKFEDDFENEWVRRGLKDRLITNETKLDYIRDRMVANYKSAINMRIIPSSRFYITNDIAIYNNVVSIASLEKGNLVGVEIENEEIAKTQKSIFEIVWEVAKPIGKIRDKI